MKHPSEDYSDIMAETSVTQTQVPEAIPVHIASSSAEPVRDVSPEYGTCMTWNVDTLTNLGKPVQILTRRYRRFKAVVHIPSLGIIGQSQYSQGSVTSPGALATITTIATGAIIPGTYLINWSVQLGGTLGAGDANNFRLQGAGLPSGIISNNAPVAGVYPQPAFQATLVAPFGTALFIKDIAAGTVGAIYSAVMSLTPVSPALGATLVVSSRIDNLAQPNPQGATFSYAPITFQWETQRPLYAVLTPTSAGPIPVTTIDQAYEET